MTEHECVFVEEQEPSGRLVLPPCIVCDTSAMDAIAQLRAAEAERDQWKESFTQAAERGDAAHQRREAAEAEADRLKAALQYALDSMESPDAEYAHGKDIYDSHMIRGAIVRARAALAPADRNTT